MECGRSQSRGTGVNSVCSTEQGEQGLPWRRWFRRKGESAVCKGKGQELGGLGMVPGMCGVGAGHHGQIGGS